MANETKTICGDCRFWSHFGGEIKTGECRINPPVLIVARYDCGEMGTRTDVDTMFPVTGLEQWCGRAEAVRIRPCTCRADIQPTVNPPAAN